MSENNANHESDQENIELLKKVIKEIERKINAEWEKRLKEQKKKCSDLLKDLQKEMNKALEQAYEQIQKLHVKTIEQEDEIRALNQKITFLIEKIKELNASPLFLGLVIKVSQDRKTAIIVNSAGQPMKTNIANVRIRGQLKPGQEVILNQGFHIIDISNDNILTRGGIVRIKQILEDGARVLLDGGMNNNIVAYVDEKLRKKLKPGDAVIWDPQTNFVLKKIELEDELQDLELEKVPDITWKDIGGLNPQVEKIKQEFVWPVVYHEDFARYDLPPTKGGLLTGPPGCGKTLVGKAFANYMAKLVAEKLGKKDVKGYFSYIGGPELSSKWVGETERMLRELFKKAREKSKDGTPVVLFFDEIESFLRTRGSGISSDVKDDYVTQFNALMDGMTEINHVFVLGATNRPDMIDPAVMREGRLTLKLEINRPDKEGAKEIFRIYLKPNLPFHPNTLNGKTPEDIVEKMINKATEFIFAKNEATLFMEVTYHDATQEILYFADFISGAKIEEIVRRAKKNSILNKRKGRLEGISFKGLMGSIVDVYHESKYLIDVRALHQEFVFRPGKKPIAVKSLIEEKIIKKKRGEIKKEPDKRVI